MSSTGKSVINRLTRWRHFQEERVSGELLQAQHAASVAVAASERATVELGSIADWKSRSVNSSRMDLSLYVELLAFETAAQERHDRRRAEEATCDRHLKDCKDAAREARSRSKVAETRQRRASNAAADREEKRLFDLTADQWAAQRFGK